MIILVEEAAKSTPVTAVTERLLTGIENAALPHRLQFIVDAAHHMNVREIVELKVFSDVKLFQKPLGRQIGHEVAHFRFAGCRQSDQQNDIKYVFCHVKPFPFSFG